MSWRPSCQLSALKQRAELLRQTRQFFLDKAVLEVETPLLSNASVTDLHLASISAQVSLPGQSSLHTMYLQTSPEFAMKRLLAAGAGPIYQITKCFRDGELGVRHNPEFTMLEWYRPGFSLNDLMAEVAEYIASVAGLSLPDIITYQQAFSDALGIDPHRIDNGALYELTVAKVSIGSGQGFSENGVNGLSRDDCLDLLLSHCIEPQLGVDKPVFMVDYPASQASLAKVKTIDGIRLAQRFELYANGLELANGYDELVDPEEQLRRFEADNIARYAHQLPEVAIDYHLIDALKEGLPECSGVALGLDRLQMVMQNSKRIDDVMPFKANNA